MDTTNLEVIAGQPGREPWSVVDISYHSPDSTPGAVKTKSCLDDGTPFPTPFYLTDLRLIAEASRLETTSVMKEMTARLENDAKLAADYQCAYEALLAEYNEMEDLGADFSGGSMSTRVKCLHVLIACVLAKGLDHFRLGTESVALTTENEKLRGTVVPTDWPMIVGLDIVYPGTEG